VVDVAQIIEPKQLYYSFRRWALRTLVPDAYWPEHVVLNGARIDIRKTPYSFGVRRSLVDGSYEVAERELICGIVKPGMHVLELGGSIGIIAAVLEHHVGRQGRVVTVEASPRLSGFSRTWLERSGVVKVVTGYAFPVWELPPDLTVHGFSGDEVSLGGHVAFGYGGESSGGGAAIATATRTVPRAVAGPKLSTEPRSYDISTLCAEHDLQPELLVMDIEASEAVVLKQRANLPASLKHIVVELHPWMYADGERDQQRILDAFASEGFVLRRQVGHNFWLVRESGV